MKNVLVTGGAGYLGSHVVEKLLKNDYKIKILDNLSFGNKSLNILKKKYNFELINGDIRDLQSLLKSADGVDAIIHLAGIVGDPASNIDQTHSTEVNYLSTKLIVDVAKYFKIKQLLFASTCSVYGASNNRILNENSKLNPVSLYSETKLKSEKILLEDGKTLSPTILRVGTLFGYSERMRFDLVINYFAGQATTNNKIIIEGGNQWRPFLHVKDAAEAYVLTLEEKRSKMKGIFNLGCNEHNYQIKEFGKFIQDIFPKVKITTTKKIDERNYRVSFKKIRKALNFECNTSISDGILEIKKAITSGKIKSWTDPIYYNNRFPFIGKNKYSKYYWK